MSGLEVAGVVLGALPLVIAALEQYTQGIHTAKRYWRYKPELRSLTVQIRTEHRIYVNTLEQLLTGIVRMEHMSELLSNPDGDTWRDVQLNNSMKERLSDAYDVYFDNVRAMSAALKKIMEELALDPDGKVQVRWSWTPRAPPLRTCCTNALCSQDSTIQAVLDTSTNG